MSIIRRTFWLLVCCWSMLALPVSAQSVASVTVDPSTLLLTTVKDHGSAAVTFYVTPAAGVSTISFSISDLQDSTGRATIQPVITAGQAIFSPASIENPLPGQRQQIQLRLSDLAVAGSWKGMVSVQWAGDSPGELALPITVAMQTLPALTLEAPAQIVVRAMQGEQIGKRGVTILETTGGSPATNVSIYPQNLYSDDQSQTIPSSAIQAALSPQEGGQPLTSIDGGSRADVVVGLNLAGVHSGSYKGSLVLQSDNAADLLIPIQVDVKDWWLGPLVALLAGVVLGVLLTMYRSSVMPKDKVRVRIQQIKEYEQQDKEFSQYCGEPQAHAQIALAENLLRDDRHADAATAVAQVETLLDNWRQSRKSLLESIQAIDALEQEIVVAGEDAGRLPCLIAIKSDMLMTRDNQIPDYVTKPGELRTKILAEDSGWRVVVRQVLALSRALTELRNTLSTVNSTGPLMDVEDLAGCQSQLSQLDAELRAISGLPTLSSLVSVQSTLANVRNAIDQGVRFAKDAVDRYNGFVLISNPLVSDIADDPALSTELHILGAAGFVQDTALARASDLLRAKRLKEAIQMVENCWRAANACRFLQSSAKEYRQGATGDPWAAVVSAERAVSAYLQTSDNYMLPAAQFFSGLAPLLDTLRNETTAASDKIFRLDWIAPQASGVGVLGAGMEDAFVVPDLEVKAADQDTYISAGGMPGLTRVLPWDPAWWTPRRRLWAINIVTFVIGVGLLAFTGYKELYSSVTTFGADGGWDYFKLFVWGFGAEAGRSQVVDLVREWGVSAPAVRQ